VPKKAYLLSIGTFLLIPIMVVVGGFVAIAINPEIAAGHPDYVRNFRLLLIAKQLSMLAGALVVAGLWCLTCYFQVRSRERPLAWSMLAVLGPFGFIALTMLRDRLPAPADRYQACIGRLKANQRLALELCVFVVAWVLAYEVVVWKRELMITLESAITGVSREQIIDVQAASGGMWAFGEGLQVMYLVVLLYLFWPIAFNVVAGWRSRRRAA
jgi:hypothetical protein